MDIAQHLNEIRAGLPQEVSLVCVSKFHPASAIVEAYEAGARIFGESRVQEMCAKYEELHEKEDIQWHFIGHLQTNKIKNIVPFVHLIHGVDSPRLLEAINKEAAKVGRIVNCLLQVHIATEETKFGFSDEELLEYVSSGEWRNLPYVRVCGLMGMASNTDNEEQVRAEFHRLRELFLKVKNDYFTNVASFKELSMGMSHDYQIAISEGSTMVRIGTAIFGERVY